MNGPTPSSQDLRIRYVLFIMFVEIIWAFMRVLQYLYAWMRMKREYYTFFFSIGSERKKVSDSFFFFLSQTSERDMCTRAIKTQLQQHRTRRKKRERERGKVKQQTIWVSVCSPLTLIVLRRHLSVVIVLTINSFAFRFFFYYPRAWKI